MKQKPDEMPDEWVRQSLGQLPDAPPPGSTFDTERLWAQLRPELDTMPVRRQPGWAWWAVAACLSGLILGRLLLYQPAAEPINPVARKTVKKAGMPLLTSRTPYVATKLTHSKSAHSAGINRIVGLRKERNKSENPKYNVIEPTPKPTETVAQLPELPAATQMPPVTATLPEPDKPNVTAVTLKRRFRVVHQNELRAEEEARPKLYHTEHFVRIGIRQGEASVPEEHPAAPIMSLTNKPNQ